MLYDNSPYSTAGNMLLSSRCVRHLTLLRYTLASEGWRPRSTSDSDVRRLEVEPAAESDRAPLVVVVVGGISRCVSSALPVRGARIVPVGPEDRKRRDSPVREAGWAEGAGGWTVMLVIPTAPAVD